MNEILESKHIRYT